MCSARRFVAPAPTMETTRRRTGLFREMDTVGYDEHVQAAGPWFIIMSWVHGHVAGAGVSSGGYQHQHGAEGEVPSASRVVSDRGPGPRIAEVELDGTSDRVIYGFPGRSPVYGLGLVARGWRPDGVGGTGMLSVGWNDLCVHAGMPSSACTGGCPCADCQGGCGHRRWQWWVPHARTVDAIAGFPVEGGPTATDDEVHARRASMDRGRTAHARRAIGHLRRGRGRCGCRRHHPTIERRGRRLNGNAAHCVPTFPGRGPWRIVFSLQHYPGTPIDEHSPCSDDQVIGGCGLDRRRPTARTRWTERACRWTTPVVLFVHLPSSNCSLHQGGFKDTTKVNPVSEHYCWVEGRSAEWWC